MHFLHGKVLYITFIAGDKEEETSKKEKKKNLYQLSRES